MASSFKQTVFPSSYRASSRSAFFKRFTTISSRPDCWYSLLRMMPSDDTLPLLGIIQSNHSWFKTLDKKLQAMTIYAFLREKRHLEFVDSFLQGSFLDVASHIGRDFIRLIQEAAEASPLVLNLWKRMINDPRSLDPGFTGIDSLLAIPLDADFVKCRLSYEMENKMLYILSHCKQASKDHQSHINWYVRAYLEKYPYVSLLILVGTCTKT
jgi:hypothetical protein